MAPEIAQHWTWEECGRIPPDPRDPLRLHHEGYSRITALAISADGSLLVSNTGRAIGWRVADLFDESEPLWTVGGEGTYNVDLSADGRLGSISGDLRIVFDAQTGRELFREGYVGHEVDLVGSSPCIGSDFVFSADGSLVAGKHYTSIVDVLETDGFTLVGQFQTTGCGQGIAWDAGGETVTAPDGSGAARKLPTAPLVPVKIESESYKLTSLTRAPNGAVVTTVCMESGCSSNGLTWTEGGRHVSISPEGQWYALGGKLLHQPSREMRVFDQLASEALFAPNGDIIVGEQDATLVRFCRRD